MDSQSKKISNRMTANNKCKTINPELKFSSHPQNKKNVSKSKQEKKEEEKKNEENKKIDKKEKKEESKLEAKININSITNNNNSHNIYVINNYFEEKKNLNNNENFPVGKWKDGKRYDRKGVEIKKGGKQKLTFVDKIGKGKLIETIPIESFKEYNLIEEVSEDRKNSCCYIY
jgi:hypothetical protein